MEKKCPLWAHMVHHAQTEESGAPSYKAKKLAGAISEVREKYATEAQSRGSDAFHARPPEIRGILEFFSDISRGSCAFLLNPSAPFFRRPTARGSCAKKRASNTLTRCAMYMFPPRKCLRSAFLRFISTCGHLKMEYGRSLPRERKTLRWCRYEAFKIRSQICRWKISLACNKCLLDDITEIMTESGCGKANLKF